MKQDGTKYSAIYVELDTLLDTRMAVLTEFGDDAVKLAIDTGYYTRPFDIFPGIDNDKYQSLYDNRKKQILLNAIVTPVAKILNEFTLGTIKNTNNSPFHYKPKVILNVYPYKLTSSEMETMAMVVANITANAADVEIVELSNEQLSPLYFKLNVSVAIMYRYDLWFKTHCELKSFEKYSCPDVSLIAPRIYFTKPERQPKDNEDPFKATEETIAPYIGLMLLPIDTFSMVVKLSKQT